MSRNLLVDAGPIVALLDRRDRYHAWATNQMSASEPPLWTCEPVLAEAAHLLRRAQGEAALLELLRRGLITTPFRLIDEVARVAKLMSRYANVPMSLADACLVRMAELNDNSAVMTLDRDFRIYRKNGRQVIPGITPDEQ